MNNKVVFCGGGNMATGMMSSMLDRGALEAANVTVSELRQERCDFLNETYGVNAVTDASSQIKEADVIIIAVLPQHIRSVTKTLAGNLKDGTLVISIVAGVTVGMLEEQIGADNKIVRLMPNTLSKTGNGYSAVVENANINGADQEVVNELVGALGQVMRITEDLFDVFSAYGCAGPLWMYKLAEAMIDAGVYSGFSRQDSRNMVIKNMIGAALNLEITGAHPLQKVDEMCSPGGVTIEGLKTLEDKGFNAAVLDSVAAAVNKVKAL